MSQADSILAAQEAPATLRLDPGDDVATALRPLAPGETLEGVTVAEAIPQGHKMALGNLDAGAAVRKFGWPIGRATRAIRAGAHVHGHNLETLLTGIEAYRYAAHAASPLPDDAATRFQGY